MKSISLYEEKQTPLHRLDPLSKLLYILVAIVCPFLLSSRGAAAVFIALSVLLLLLGRVFRRCLPILGFSGLILVTVVLIQGMFHDGNVTPVLTAGPVTFYREGLLFSLGIALNVVNILLSITLLVLTTKPSDMVESFVRLGLSPKLGYVMGSVFQIIPEMTDTMATITDAQRSRGMETEGKLFTRVKAFFPLISPVVLSSLIITRERAVALEVRGFSSRRKKTFLNEREQTPGQKAVKIVLLGILLLSLLGRVYLWLR